MKKKSVNLIYKFSGDIDSINLFEIAPILLSLGQLIQDSNKIVNPTAEEIGINAKPFEKGSFIIEILLFAKTNAQQILDFVGSDNGQQIKTLLEYIGLIGGIGGGSFAGVKGLIGLIKFLKGKPPQKLEKVNENETKLTTDDGKSITINNHVINLYKNSNIKNNITNSFVRPLEQNSVETIDSYLKDDEENTHIQIDQTIKEYIKDYAQSAELSTQEQEMEETFYISPKRGSFSGESNSWSFRLSTNKDIIKIDKILDTKFLKKCKDGEIRPFEKDMLKVKVKTTYDPETLNPKKREILEVLEYRKYRDNAPQLF